MTSGATRESVEDRVARLERELAAARAEQLMSRTVLETAPAVVLRLSLDLRIEYINRILPEYRGASLIGESVFAFAPPDQHDVMRAALEAAVATRQPTTYETIAAAPDGTSDWYFSIVGPIMDGETLLGLTLLCTNVSRLKAAEAELQDSQARLEVALDAGRVGLWRWDAALDAVEWDVRLIAMFGLAQETAPRRRADWLALMPDDARERMSDHIDEALRTGDYPDFELSIGEATERRWFIVRGGPMRSSGGRIIGLMGGVLEVTRQQQLEEQLRHTQKLEAVGELAAGIAHNFNNMLAAIVPVLEVARRGLPSEAGVIDMALTSATHAAELVRELMAFARSDRGAGGVTENLEAIVRRAAELCSRTFARHVRVELGDVSATQGVVVEGARTEQALLNLLVNARDAVDELEEDRRIITLSARALSEADARRTREDASGDFVELVVEDHGPGIDASTKDRIFEPFFTTKPQGRGTGLGLSTAWAAARAQGGFLACESRVGAGTTFLLAVPARRRTGQRATAEAAPPRPALRVMVIDDDPMVLRVTTMMLEELGHHVIGARSGEDAERLARLHPVEVVVMDRSMPGQPPETTMTNLRAITPDLPIIAFSGLSPGLVGATVELQKPATIAQLAGALLEATAAPRPEPRATQPR